MQVRKMAVAVAVVAGGMVAGMVGQSLAAGAQRSVQSDKTLYAQTNPAFVQNVTDEADVAKTLLKVTVHAPSAGVAEIRINSQVWSDFGSTTTSVEENVLTLGRCVVANTLVNSKCKAKSTVWFHKPENSDGDDSTFPYSIDALMSFNSAGKHTLYLNGASNNDPAGLWGDGFAHVQVAFTPRHPISAGSLISVSALLPGHS